MVWHTYSMNRESDLGKKKSVVAWFDSVWPALPDSEHPNHAFHVQLHTKTPFSFPMHSAKLIFASPSSPSELLSIAHRMGTSPSSLGSRVSLISCALSWKFSPPHLKLPEFASQQHGHYPSGMIWMERGDLPSSLPMCLLRSSWASTYSPSSLRSFALSIWPSSSMSAADAWKLMMPIRRENKANSVDKVSPNLAMNMNSE